MHMIRIVFSLHWPFYILTKHFLCIQILASFLVWPKCFRFRPNIFIDGPFPAFAEDKWPWVRTYIKTNLFMIIIIVILIIVIIVVFINITIIMTNITVHRIHFNRGPQVKIGEVVFRHAQLCDRCDFTQVFSRKYIVDFSIYFALEYHYHHARLRAVWSLWF